MPEQKESDKQRQLNTHRRNLAHLEERAARYGGEVNIPLDLFNDIRDTREAIERLEEEIAASRVAFETSAKKTSTKAFHFGSNFWDYCLIVIMLVFAIFSLFNAPIRPDVAIPSTLSPNKIDTILAELRSPAIGTGTIWFTLGLKYGIDPAYALAFFVEDSDAGTKSRWVGLKPDGGITHNIGNILCNGHSRCFGKYRDYPNWQEGIEDFYNCMAKDYVVGRNMHTFEQIYSQIKSDTENIDIIDNREFPEKVTDLVDTWRQSGIQLSCQITTSR